MRLTGQMQLTTWQEDELRALDGGGKLTRAAIGYRVSGDVEGEATSDVVMAYSADGTATVVGFWQVTGTAAGRTGSVVFEAVRQYDGTTVTSRVRTVPGTGSGELSDVSAQGSTSATSELITYDLEL